MCHHSAGQTIGVFTGKTKQQTIPCLARSGLVSMFWFNASKMSRRCLPYKQVPKPHCIMDPKSFRLPSLYRRIKPCYLDTLSYLLLRHMYSSGIWQRETFLNKTNQLSFLDTMAERNCNGYTSLTFCYRRIFATVEPKKHLIAPHLV